MKNFTKMTTAWSPSFGMSTSTHPCALALLGAGGVAVQGESATARVVIARVKGDFPGSHAWSPPSS